MYKNMRKTTLLYDACAFYGIDGCMIDNYSDMFLKRIKKDFMRDQS